jgi:hypothetical protein
MGVYGLWWYEQNNIPYTVGKHYSQLFNKEVEYRNYEQWYGGRIDCHCNNYDDTDYERYGVELGLPIMDNESYYRFSEWLNSVSTISLVNTEELIQLYEYKTNHKLRLWEDGLYKEQQ